MVKFGPKRMTLTLPVVGFGFMLFFAFIQTDPEYLGWFSILFAFLLVLTLLFDFRRKTPYLVVACDHIEWRTSFRNIRVDKQDVNAIHFIDADTERPIVYVHSSIRQPFSIALEDLNTKRANVPDTLQQFGYPV